MDVVKPSATAVDEQLARILASPQFCESPRLQDFLRFVVALTIEGKTDEIKESTIASEVFRRMDTKEDSIVRSAARRLRSRLDEYYEHAGVNDSVRIVIPKGSYVPDIREWPLAGVEQQEGSTNARTRTENADTAATIYIPPNLTVHAQTGSSPRKFGRTRLWALLAVAAVLAATAAIAIAWRERRVDGSGRREARELYLRGRYYWSKRTPEDLNRAIDYFTQAIVKDPRDAEAYVGLADTYNLMSEYTAMPYHEAFTRAIAAAETAIQLDGALPEAHNSLAFASFWGAWDSVTAEREFKRAIELNPNYSTAHHWYATFLICLARYSEALEQIEQAQALEPSSRAILADKGLILLYAGQPARAQALLEEVEAADPQFLSPHRYLASVYLLGKRYENYLAELKKIAALTNDSAALEVVKAGEEGFAKAGAKGMLEAMLKIQESFAGKPEARYYETAVTCALLRNTSKAIEYLRLAYQNREAGLVSLAGDHCFSDMRNDPEFRKIVRRVGVAPPQPQ